MIGRRGVQALVAAVGTGGVDQDEQVTAWVCGGTAGYTRCTWTTASSDAKEEDGDANTTHSCWGMARR